VKSAGHPAAAFFFCFGWHVDDTADDDITPTQINILIGIIAT
jgi:hypothetical protein